MEQYFYRKTIIENEDDSGKTTHVEHSIMDTFFTQDVYKNINAVSVTPRRSFARKINILITLYLNLFFF